MSTNSLSVNEASFPITRNDGSPGVIISRVESTYTKPIDKLSRSSSLGNS